MKSITAILFLVYLFAGFPAMVAATPSNAAPSGATAPIVVTSSGFSAAADALNPDQSHQEKPWAEIYMDFSGSGFMTHVFDKKTNEDLINEFKTRTGIDLFSDLHSLAARIDFNHPEPSIRAAIKGRFDPKKVVAELGMEFKDLLVTPKWNGLLLAQAGQQAEIFISPAMIAIADSESGLFSNDNSPLPVFEGMFTSRSTGCLEVTMVPSGLVPEPTMLPQSVQNSDFAVSALSVLRGMVQLKITAGKGRIIIRGIPADPTAAPGMADTLKGFIGLGRILITAQETSVKKKMSEGSAFRLLSPDIMGSRNSIRAGRDFLDKFQIETEKSVVLISFKTGDLLDSSGVLMPIVAITGVMAAIAIPNFVKARDTARQRACLASLRLLTGALEMYSMDHDEPMNPRLSVSQIQDELFSKGYIRTPVKCPSKGEYKMESNDGFLDVKCSIHGGIGDGSGM